MAQGSDKPATTGAAADDYGEFVAAGTCPEHRTTGCYIGSLVADFHRNLIKGDIYLYPPTSKSPGGKLRLLYECFPMAFIAEQASGCATDGRQLITDVVPTELHQRSVLCVGSPDLIDKLLIG